jgi:hypothetical protein
MFISIYGRHSLRNRKGAEGRAVLSVVRAVCLKAARLVCSPRGLVCSPRGLVCSSFGLSGARADLYFHHKSRTLSVVS